jgi:nucleotide-binding universal stress UspA family protein
VTNADPCSDRFLDSFNPRRATSRPFGPGRRGEAIRHTHVVDDDRPEELVHLEEREAERVLAEQMGSMPELRGVECRPMLVPGDPFDGVLKAAAEASADLIVMAHTASSSCWISLSERRSSG